MRINGLNGTNAPTGTMGMGNVDDAVSKNIQNQIANAQKELQDLSSNEEMSLEDKMKKRQEIQQEIANLNQQLRQHQIQMRREQQSQKSSKDDAAASRKNTSAEKGTGLSQAGMQTMISADASMKQAKIQGSTASHMQGQARVLEAEIKRDAGRGNTERKEEALADLQSRAQSAANAQMSTLAEANNAINEAVGKEEESANDVIQKQNGTDKTDKMAKTEASESETGRKTSTDETRLQGQSIDLKL